MSEAESNTTNAYDNVPPDIVQTALPFLSPKDIKNLSHTNKYFHKLLNYESSETLWHDLFHKAYGRPYSNDEPFQTKDSGELRTCGEVIMLQDFSSLSWQERFKVRTEQVKLYTWGCLKHGRLGYTANSNSHLSSNNLNSVGMRIKYGVNSPTMVPWFEESNSTDESAIVQVSSGGFAFQILTRSGKLYTTGSSFSGGHNGPGPKEGEHDYNPFREAVHDLETSFSRYRSIGITPGTFGVIPYGGTMHHGPTPTVGPHPNIYQDLEDMEKNAAQTIPGNSYIRRVFTRNCFDIFISDSHSFKVDKEKLDSIKFVAVSSGRSHFLALDENNNLYSWDSPNSDYGVRLSFKGLPSIDTNPIWKIGSGWDLNCIYVYKVGLIVWNKRDALKKGELASDVYYTIIPNTSDISGPGRVVDFACCQGDCVFFITNDRKILWVYSNGIVQQLRIPVEGEYVKVTVCFTILALFTNEKCYTIKIKNSKLDMSSLTELQLEESEDRIISLATGDYHTVALTSKGQIYTWGLESQLCGCLGLGSPESVIEEEHHGRWDSIRNMRVEQPTKVKLNDEYTCVAVCAGGWQSGALIMKR